MYQLQRIGRTGRKKDGDIAVLVAEGKEETNFEKAKEAYNMVQNSITKGDRIELYSDVPRLLPTDIHPQPQEMVMPIVGYKREASNARTSKSLGSIDKYVTKTRPPKEPKLTAKERKKMLAEAVALVNADSDESESLDLDLGTTKGEGKAKESFVEEKSPSKPRKSKKANDAPAPSGNEKSAKPRKKKPKRVETPSSSDDDEEILHKTIKKSAKKKDTEVDRGSSRRTSKKEPKASRKRARMDDDSESLGDSPPRRKKKRREESEEYGRSSSSPDVPLRIRLLTSPTLGFVTGTGRKLVPSTSSAPIEISSDDEDLSVRNTGNEPNPEPLLGSASSSLRTRPSPPTKAIGVEARENFTRNQTPALFTSFHDPRKRNSPDYPMDTCLDNSPQPPTSQTAPRLSGTHDWLLDSDSDGPVMHRVLGSPKPSHSDGQTNRGLYESLDSHSAVSPVMKRSGQRRGGQVSFAEKLEDPGSSAKPTTPVFNLDDSSVELLTGSGLPFERNDARCSRQRREPEMTSFDSSPATHANPALVAPELSSSPIRPPGRTKRGRNTAKTSAAYALLSEAEEDEHRSETSDGSPILGHKHHAKNGTRRRRPVYDRNNEFVAMEADLSGEDVVGGSTDTEGEEDEYDHEFIADGDVTQRSDYDQSAMYLQGLQTQAPDGLKFANRPVRVGLFGRAFGVDKPSERPVHLSSSPPRSSEDVYEFGSFVVEESDFEGED